MLKFFVSHAWVFFSFNFNLQVLLVLSSFQFLKPYLIMFLKRIQNVFLDGWLMEWSCPICAQILVLDPPTFGRQGRRSLPISACQYSLVGFVQNVPWSPETIILVLANHSSKGMLLAWFWIQMFRWIYCIWLFQAASDNQECWSILECPEGNLLKILLSFCKTQQSPWGSIASSTQWKRATGHY